MLTREKVIEAMRALPEAFTPEELLQCLASFEKIQPAVKLYELEEQEEAEETTESFKGWASLM
jgi:hypothetical protein